MQDRAGPSSSRSALGAGFSDQYFRKKDVAGEVRAHPEYDPHVRRLILLLLALGLCAACAGNRAPSPRTAPPAGSRTALEALKLKDPATEWNDKSLLRADLDLDGGDDFALSGVRKDRFMVGIVRGTINADSQADSRPDSRVWTLDFPWDGGEDALCSKKAKIVLEPLEENEGPKPGHPRKGMGINLSDDRCDAFHIYWDPREKTFAYWRL